MKGLITEIERFALNDGPGIRTTVFFKGCNMHCEWCHNPETIRTKRELMYYPDKCIRCFKCVFSCPCKAHKKIDNEQRFFPQLCVQCGKCAAVCYAGAMEMSGSLMSVDEIMEQVIQDKPYYKDSKGGVTLSGGEVLMQQEFAEKLTKACHAENIPVGIETNLSFAWRKIEPFIEQVDLVMCDLKIADSAAHKEWTGIGNEQIKENIRKLDEVGKPHIVRTPLVPGATDSDENIMEIANFLRDANKNNTLLYYELLNFNPLGHSKYGSLGRKDPFEGARPLSETRVEQLRTVASNTGLETRVG